MSVPPVLDVRQAHHAEGASPSGPALGWLQESSWWPIADVVPMVVAYVDAQQRYQFVNRYAEIRFELPREQLIGRSVRSVIGDEAYAVARPKLEEALGGRDVCYETWMTIRGVPRRMRATYQPHRGAGGAVLGLLVVVEDITERRREDEAVRERQRRLERQHRALVGLTRGKTLTSGRLDAAFAEIACAAADVLDVERVSVWLYNDSKTSIRCLDLYERAAQRHSHGAVLPAADSPSYFAALEHARIIAAHDAPGDALTAEFAESYLRPHGIASMLAAPICLRGTVVGVVCHEHTGPPRQWTADEQQFAGSVADLAALALESSDRAETQNALRRSRRDLQDFLENGAVGLQWVGADGRILWANQAEMDLLGYSRDEYFGRAAADFHADPATIEDMRRRLARGEMLQGYEARLRCKDGSIKHVLIDSSALWDNGRFVHTRCFTRDITQRKETEERLAASLRELDASRRLDKTAGESL